MDVTITIRVTVNTKNHDQMNRARRKLGRQEVSAYDEVENALVSAVQHNFVFEKVEVIQQEKKHAE